MTASHTAEYALAEDFIAHEGVAAYFPSRDDLTPGEAANLLVGWMLVFPDLWEPATEESGSRIEWDEGAAIELAEGQYIMRKTYADLGSLPYLTRIVADVQAIWEAHGSPAPPVSGTSTDTRHPCTEADPSDIGDWAGAEAQACGHYNVLREQLGRLVDVRGFGGFAVTTWSDGTEAWESYRQVARDLISEWDAHEAWDLFCSHHEDDDWPTEQVAL